MSLTGAWEGVVREEVRGWSGGRLPHPLPRWRLVIGLFIGMKGKRLPLAEPWSPDKMALQEGMCDNTP
jgi:hypothetical protein